MNRVILSPSATSLARLLYRRAEHQPTFPFNDHQAGFQLGLEADTIYRALCDLRALGALTFTRKSWAANRQVTVDLTSWVWVYVAATSKAGA